MHFLGSCKRGRAGTLEFFMRSSNLHLHYNLVLYYNKELMIETVALSKMRSEREISHGCHIAWLKNSLGHGKTALKTSF